MNSSPVHDFLMLCPACGSAVTNFSMLAAGNASCTNCKWLGTTDDLVGRPVAAPVTSEAFIQQLITLVQGILGPHAREFVDVAVKMRIIGTPPDREEAMLLMNTLAQNILKGYIESAEKLEEARYVRQAKLLPKA